jgi:subtilase family serine protease
MGSVVYINVTVQNVGNGSAENVLIVGKMDGQQVGQKKFIPYFRAHSNFTVSFTWFANEGEHTFQISIDPNSVITESSKANNNASRMFMLAGPTDLTSIVIAAGFILAAIGVMAFYVLRVRKK